MTATTRTAVSLLLVLLQPLVVAWFLQVFFENPPLGEMPFSENRWQLLARDFMFTPTFFYLLASNVVAAAVVLPIGRLRGKTWGEAVGWVGVANVWPFLLGVSVLTQYFVAARLPDWLAPLLVVQPWLVCLAVAGWLQGHWQSASPPTGRWAAAWIIVLLASLTFAGLFSLLSIAQYQALHVPHGDTGMYEEHLWNVLHGKGFRSQLDDGRLFLGEHLQVIHLFLLPIYVFAPSLPTLNVCQNLALASGALAVMWICRRQGLSPAVAVALSFAYLLYFPLQYLSIELQWKTFRPETFGVPLLLFTLAALESKRYRLMLVLLALTLLVKEEYAIAAGGIGAYLLLRSGMKVERRREFWLGFYLAVFSGLYLLFVLKVSIPYFRGNTPHFTPYFTQIRNNPRDAVSLLVRWDNFRFLLLLLAPLLFIPLCSPSRFVVALPFLVYLMLGDPDRDLNKPFFHFHAPLVGLLFWSASGGLANIVRAHSWLLSRKREDSATPDRITGASIARLVTCMALVTGIWYGKSPGSWKFYDPLESMPRNIQSPFVTWEPMGSYWRDIYLPTDRALVSFPKVLALIGPEDRVAATDYIRNRFTHCRAAHDYPRLRGHVTIDDIDVIVLDQTEGWWGRGPTNPDRQLLACMNDPSCTPGTQLHVRDKLFRVEYHDEYFLMVRRVKEVP